MARPPKDPTSRLDLAGSKPLAGHDGLTPILDMLIADPARRRYAVVEFWGATDKITTDEGTHQIVVRWSRIEPVFDDDEATVQKMLDAAREARLDAEDERAGRLSLTAGQEND